MIWLVKNFLEIFYNNYLSDENLINQHDENLLGVSLKNNDPFKNY